jgi:hypothetical protein
MSFRNQTQIVSIIPMCIWKNCKHYLKTTIPCSNIEYGLWFDYGEVYLIKAAYKYMQCLKCVGNSYCTVNKHIPVFLQRGQN